MTEEINPSLSWNINEKRQSEIYSKRWKGNQRRIGITGGIASGKSSVAEYLKNYKNLPILDADIYAKNILSPGTEISKSVIGHFGENIIDNNCESKQVIDRAVLAEKIFSNKKERIWLEKLIHPIVRKTIEDNLQINSNKSIIVIIIPLLFEAGLMDVCSEIWVVDCSQEKQIKRLMKRNSLSRKQSIERINSQFPLNIKRNLADVIIDNNNKPKDLINQIEDLF